MKSDYIKKWIEEDVRVDIYGDLYGHDRIAEDLADMITALENRIEELKKKPAEPWVDRMGGQFTAEEIAESERGGHGW